MTLTDAGVPWAVRVATMSEQLAADLDRRTYMTELAAWVRQVARDNACTRLVGASESGRRIVEAAGQPHPGEGSPTGNKVLIVDGLLATGANLVAAVERIREEGATGITIVAALADANAIEAVRNELGADVLAMEIAA